MQEKPADMHGKLVALKSIIWSVGIAVCLLSLAVGFFFAAFTKYDGSGKIVKPERQTSASDREGTPGGEQSPEQSSPPAQGGGELLMLQETEDGGQAYIDRLTFLCDSALIGLRDYGVLTGGSATSQVWGSEAGNIPVADYGQCVIRYPGDGSQITAANAAMVARPGILVISLGVDSLAQATEESFTEGYTQLINAIRTASPDTAIVCCSVTGVTVSYNGSDGMTSSLAVQADDWVRHLCQSTGVYYADAASAVTDSSGSLLNEYAAANGKSVNVQGLTEILSYLRTHMVP